MTPSNGQTSKTIPKCLILTFIVLQVHYNIVMIIQEHAEDSTVPVERRMVESRKAVKESLRPLLFLRS